MYSPCPRHVLSRPSFHHPWQGMIDLGIMDLGLSWIHGELKAFRGVGVAIQNTRIPGRECAMLSS